jgi:hypothetical protein
MLDFFSSSSSCSLSSDDDYETNITTLFAWINRCDSKWLICRDDVANVCIGNFRYLIMSLEHTPVDRTFKILFIGDSSVGKTCLMFRYSGMY